LAELVNQKAVLPGEACVFFTDPAVKF